MERHHNQIDLFLHNCFSGDSAETDTKKLKETVMGELKNTFRPEFLNRVDEIIVFHKLTSEDIKEIAKRMLKTLSKRVEGLGLSIVFTDAAVEAIAKAGFDPVYGARPLRRAIQSKIEDKLSEEMLEKKFTGGKKVICDFKEDTFVFLDDNKQENV